MLLEENGTLREPPTFHFGGERKGTANSFLPPLVHVCTQRCGTKKNSQAYHPSADELDRRLSKVQVILEDQRLNSAKSMHFNGTSVDLIYFDIKTFQIWEFMGDV